MSGIGTPFPGREHFFERALERLPAGAYCCDPDGLITWYNDAAVHIWGRKPKLNDPADRFCGSFRLYDVEGKPLSHDRCWMARAITEQRVYEGREILIERPGGERVRALANASPIYDDAGCFLGAVNVLMDVTEAWLASEALRRNERGLDDFFENATVGLHWVDADGIVIRVNQSELDMLGYAREEFVGRPIADFHADPEVVQGIMARLRAGETLCSHPARMRRRDGSIRHVRISSNALFEDGRFVHTRCFTVDVTEQKRAEERLREADRRKNEFLAMLAHELRNPMAPIRNAVELMRLEGPDEPRLREARDLIDRQLTQMSRLVDDLLDLARVSRGQLTVRLERTSLESVVKSTLETVRPLIDEGGHRLELALPEQPVPLDGDPIRLAQVLLNLLSNAARYSDPGSRIELAAALQGQGARRRLRVFVRDEGRGVSPEERERIFDMFVQGSSAGADPPTGLGIGLTLVRALVELHGGRVSVRSAGAGQGSEFEVELPVATGPAREEPAGRPASSHRARRVLLVDDNADAADSLGKLLVRFGHEVKTAYDGAQALEEAERFRPEVVLLDIGLPGMDGYEVCRRLREQPWGRSAQLVAVTGWGDEEHKRRARDAGFDDHLIKPVVPQHVRELISRDGAANG